MNEIEKIREWLSTCPEKLGPYDDTARANRLEVKVKELEEKVTYYENVLSAIDPDGEGQAFYDEDPEGFD